MIPYDEDPEHAALRRELYDDGGAGHENAPDASQDIGGTIQKVALGGATKSNLSTDSAEKSRANSSVSALKVTDPLAIPEAERAAAGRMAKDMVRLCNLDWPLVVLSAYDPELVARAESPDADRETKRRAKASGKAPFGNDWQNKATSKWNDLKGWARDALDHSGRCPNLGALAGAYIPPKDGRPGGYLLPVDLDVKGPDGKPMTTRAARRAELEAKIGAALPETVSDDSPSGGGHDWFLSLNPLSVTQKIALIEGVDIPHQAAIAPSSRAGKAYAWRKGCAPWERAIAVAPSELLTFIIKQRDKSAVDKATAKAKVADGVNLDSVANRARYRDWLDRYAPEAVENEGKHKTAIGILQRGKDEGLSAIVAAAVAHDSEWNRTRCLPPYELDRLIQMSETSDTSRQNEIGSRSPEVVFDLSPEQIEKMKKDEADRKGKADNGERLVVERAGAERAGGVAAPGGGVNFRDARVKRAPYVVKGWLHRGETVQWFGPPGAGKSASLLSVMLASAAAPPEGATFAGCRVKRGLAIFAAYERAGETQDRLAAAKNRLGLSDDLPFVLLTRPPLLKDGKAAESIIEIIRHYEKLHNMPCSTFAVDTLTAARPGMGQSDDAEMSSLMNHLQHIRDTVCCCLPFIHHPTKADANNPRGSGVTTGHVDKEVVVNKGRIRMQKNNAGPDADALDLKVESVLMGEDEDGDPISVAYANIKPGRVGVDATFDGGDESVFGSGGVPERLKLAYAALKTVAAERPDGVASTNDWFDRIDADAKAAKLKKPVRATKNNHKDALVEGNYVVSEGVGFWRAL